MITSSFLRCRLLWASLAQAKGNNLYKVFRESINVFFYIYIFSDENINVLFYAYIFFDDTWMFCKISLWEGNEVWM